jgi:hypothetical protein
VSNPPHPPEPPDLPDQPNHPQTPSRNNKRTGAFVAIAAVVLISLIVELLSFIGQLLGGGVIESCSATGCPPNGVGFGAGLVAVPVVSLACVILGSILTISKRTRQFAVGFLIPGAIILVVTAGACVALIAAFSSLHSLGTA